MSAKTISKVVQTEHCTAAFMLVGDEMRISALSFTVSDVAISPAVFARIEAELDDIRREAEALRDAV